MRWYVYIENIQPCMVKIRKRSKLAASFSEIVPLGACATWQDALDLARRFIKVRINPATNLRFSQSVADSFNTFVVYGERDIRCQPKK